MPSPFQEKLVSSGAKLTERGGVAVIESFGDDGAEALRARKASALWDLSHRRLLALSGEDRVRFLNGMITQEVKNLAEGQGRYALLCNAKGKVLADLTVWGGSEALLIESDPAVAAVIAETLEKFIIADDVELEDRSAQQALLHLAGPKAPEVLAALGAPEAGEELRQSPFAWRQSQLRVARHRRTGLSGFDLWCQPEQAGALWEALLEAGARPAGEGAFSLLLLESGVPRYGTDFDESNLPQEAGLFDAFSTTKGCYVGQEVICKIQSFAHVNKNLKGFEIEAQSLPPPGAKLLSGGQEVGHLTQAARSPSLGRPIALGYVKRSAQEAGLDQGPLTIAWEGGQASARLRELPFVEP